MSPARSGPSPAMAQCHGRDESDASARSMRSKHFCGSSRPTEARATAPSGQAKGCVAGEGDPAGVGAHGGESDEVAGVEAGEPVAGPRGALGGEHVEGDHERSAAGGEEGRAEAVGPREVGVEDVGGARAQGPAEPLRARQGPGRRERALEGEVEGGVMAVLRGEGVEHGGHGLGAAEGDRGHEVDEVHGGPTRA